MEKLTKETIVSLMEDCKPINLKNNCEKAYYLNSIAQSIMDYALYKAFAKILIYMKSADFNYVEENMSLDDYPSSAEKHNALLSMIPNAHSVFEMELNELLGCINIILSNDSYSLVSVERSISKAIEILNRK